MQRAAGPALVTGHGGRTGTAPWLLMSVGSKAYRLPVGFFLCTLVHGPAWDDDRDIRDQSGWPKHAAFMDRLVEDGFIIVGGPVGAGAYTAHLVHSAQAADVYRRLADDPWAKDGHLVIGQLEPWSLWLDGRRRDRSASQPTPDR